MFLLIGRRPPISTRTDTRLPYTTRYRSRGGGEPSQAVEAGEPPLMDRTVSYEPALTRKLAGVEVETARQREILSSLGFAVADGAAWQVRVPSWRRDVDGAADLVEEVVRIEGLDKVPSTPLPRAEGVARPTATPAQKIERRDPTGQEPWREK